MQSLRSCNRGSTFTENESLPLDDALHKQRYTHALVTFVRFLVLVGEFKAANNRYFLKVSPPETHTDTHTQN